MHRSYAGDQAEVSSPKQPQQLALSRLLQVLDAGWALKVKIIEARGMVLQLDKETLAVKSKLPTLSGVFDPIHLGLAKPAKPGEYGGGMSPRLEFIEKNLAKSLQDLAKLPSACDALNLPHVVGSIRPKLRRLDVLDASHQAQWRAASASLQLLLKTITQAKQAKNQATWTAKESDKLIQAALPRLRGAKDIASVKELESYNKRLQEGLDAAAKALGKGLAGKNLNKKAMPTIGMKCGSVLAVKLPGAKEAGMALEGIYPASAASPKNTGGIGSLMSSSAPKAKAANACPPPGICQNGWCQCPVGSTPIPNCGGCVGGARICEKAPRKGMSPWPNGCCPEDLGRVRGCNKCSDGSIPDVNGNCPKEPKKKCKCLCGVERDSPCTDANCKLVCPAKCKCYCGKEIYPPCGDDPCKKTCEGWLGAFVPKPLMILGNWVLGTGPKKWDLGPNDPMTEELKKFKAIEDQRNKAKAKLAENCKKCAAGPIVEPDASYSVRDKGWREAARDYRILFFGGGNRTAAFLGSYYGTWTADKISCKNGAASLSFHIWNDSGLESGTHFPGNKESHPTVQDWVAHPISTGQNNRHGPRGFLDDNLFGEKGPMHNVKEDFNWAEPIQFDGNSKCKK